MVQQYQSPVRVYKHPFPLVMMIQESRRQITADNS